MKLSSTIKIAIIRSSKKENWHSSNEIKKNWDLVLSSLSSPFEPKSFFFNDLIHPDEFIDLFKFAPDTLIFIDNQLHPVYFFTEIPLSFLKEKKIIITIDGNFNFFPQKWLKTFEILRGLKVHFLAPSKAHKDLASLFFTNPVDQLSILPHPINSQGIPILNDLNQNQPDTFNLIFAGRLSYPKMVHKLIKAVTFLNQKSKIKVKLTLAGDFDKEPSISYLDKKIITSQYSNYLDNLINNSNGYVKRVGFLSQTNLYKVFLKMDGQVSLSLNFNEEFGLAIHQAQLTGLKGLFTSWGGHNNLREFSGNQFIPVHLDETGRPILSTKLLISSLQQFINTKTTSNERHHEAKKANQQFGLNYFVQSFEDVVSKNLYPFEGPSDFLYKYESFFSPKYPNPFFYKKNEKSIFFQHFKDIYSKYINCK